MVNATELLKQDRYNDLWNRYCGFIELDLGTFMKIQERLLLEQLKILHNCKLGKRFMGDSVPQSVSEFRTIIPLSTYKDYIDFLGNKDDSCLPSKPLYWAMTTGIPGEYDEKWAPYPYDFVLSNARAFIGAMIMSTAYDRGKFKFGYKKNFLYGMAPLPYITGTIPYGLKYEYEFEYLPDVKIAEKLNFDQRNMLGFELGFTKGIDYFFGVASVLVKIGETFSNYIRTLKINSLIKQPKKFFLLIHAYLKSIILRRKLLPRDVWNLNGIVCGGIDSKLYANEIEYYWGKKPLELYGGTEIGIVAFQSWNRKGMTFVPFTNFLEFIPWEEHERNRLDPNYIPKTVLINELKTNELYEIVITSLNSGAFVRYRVGDIIRVISNSDEEIKINLPQIRFENRAEDVIDIAGFTRLTERTIWQALINTGVKFKNWIAVKEIDKENKKPIVHIYASITDYSLDEIYCENLIHIELKKLDHDYKDYEEMIGKRPIKLDLVKEETFLKLKHFIKANQSNDKEPSPIPHMNPPKFLFDKFLEFLKEENSNDF